MSASIAITGAPWAARYRVNSADSVVLPLPPLPANAIFISSCTPFGDVDPTDLVALPYLKWLSFSRMMSE
jgi:hypothetical protein